MKKTRKKNNKENKKQLFQIHNARKMRLQMNKGRISQIVLKQKKNGRRK